MTVRVYTLVKKLYVIQAYFLTDEFVVIPNWVSDCVSDSVYVCIIKLCQGNGRCV
jgi:hypothetical protein